jgi:alpha/beta superfamily hydrolase
MKGFPVNRHNCSTVARPWPDFSGQLSKKRVMSMEKILIENQLKNVNANKKGVLILL